MPKTVRVFLQIIHFPRWTVTAGVLVAVALVLGACGVDRSGLDWPTDAQPHNVCPGENVTLSWNAHEGGCVGSGCPAPVTVNLDSDPMAVLGRTLSVGDSGTQPAGPINGATSFTFTKLGGRESLPVKTSSVAVVLPSRETHVPMNFLAGCSGSSAAWTSADLSVPIFRSAFVRLVRICNYSSQEIDLRLAFTSGTPMGGAIFPSECIPDLPAALGQSVTSANAAAITPIRTVCDAYSSLPPDILLDGVLTCDLMSASAPLVAASPEAPTSEATKSGIIVIPSRTPTSGPPQLILTRNANCRAGPGSDYESLDAYPQGQSLTADGRNETAPWWWRVLRPGSRNHCWISEIAGTPSGDPNQLPVIQLPPPPTATVKSGGIDFDKDGYPAGIDCNDKNPAIHPGAPEIAKDGIDSNCNGDDNK